AGFQINDCADLPALGCPVIDLTPFLNQAIAQGANIHNNSWGDRENYMPQNTYTAPTADMDEAVWRNPEFLIVCAAGNNGSGNDTVGSPSTGKNVISVGAAQSPTIGGSAESLANFSGRGWTSDGRIKPDLIAPGQTCTARSDYDVTTNNCNTLLLQGTSLASPVTCGAAALVREYFTEGRYTTGVKNAANATKPTAALIKAVLLNGAVDMSEVAGPPPNRDEGWGRIQLDNSLYFEGDARRIIAVDKRDYFTTATQSPYIIEFESQGNVSAGQIKITLVWTDYPAAPAATIALVNDLDLAVADANSSTTIYLGNRFDTSGNSITGGSPDTLNNVEMIILPANTTGTFRLSVKPAHLVEPPQGFALVIGGDVRRISSPQSTGWLIRGE
ncbi:MAG: S8 family serine peptidase, partial [Candidatus Sumerlaeota bacterium]|nr:S8 family serine peptidase [Candidatus Sumerlaeota bacterium]